MEDRRRVYKSVHAADASRDEYRAAFGTPSTSLACDSMSAVREHSVAAPQQDRTVARGPLIRRQLLAAPVDLDLRIYLTHLR
ncbi:hypothetical protein [Nonomuraea sp. KM90]|uniref:hypothetical protein n=1 Tax=Nonomuraea sp. KM90 TaxID=3457428 RepID=UPI003FCE769A